MYNVNKRLLEKFQSFNLNMIEIFSQFYSFDKNLDPYSDRIQINE